MRIILQATNEDEEKQLGSCNVPLKEIVFEDAREWYVQVVAVVAEGTQVVDFGKYHAGERLLAHTLLGCEIMKRGVLGP